MGETAMIIEEGFSGYLRVRADIASANVRLYLVGSSLWFALVRFRSLSLTPLRAPGTAALAQPC